MQDIARRVLTLAEAAGPARAVSDEAAGAALRSVANDVEPAIDYFLDHDEPSALRLVAALSGYWQDAGRVDEGRALTERVLALTMPRAARERDIAAEIPWALLAASELAFRQADDEQATRFANQALRAAMLIEDRPGAAMAHVALARVAYRNADAAAIEREGRLALELADGDPRAMPSLLHLLAWPAYFRADLDTAERRFEESLAYRREHGLRFSAAMEITNLGELAAERGDLSRAASLLIEALSTSHEVGSIFMLVNLVASIGVLALRSTENEDAARLFGASEALGKIAGIVPDASRAVAEAGAEARVRLGAGRYSTLATNGGALSADAAVNLALRVARRIEMRRP